MNPEQYDCLNETSTMTTPDDIPVGMEEVSQGSIPRQRATGSREQDVHSCPGRSPLGDYPLPVVIPKLMYI